jgi:hypothetical protein
MPFQFPPDEIFSLGTNWSSKAGLGSGPPKWAKLTGLVDPDVVYLQGAATQTSATPVDGSDPNLLCTLPPAASPDRVVYAIVNTSHGTYADISISPNGVIELLGPRPPAVQDYSFVSLENITYEQCLIVPPAGILGAGGSIAVNAPNWSDTADSTGFPFGASAPAWYLDGGSIVHLQGAAKQVSTSGPNPNLLGTLPLPAAWPQGRTVFTIAHTFGGTYVDIFINPEGQINLVDPRPPAVKDYSFVSLEGITYPTVLPFNAIPVNKPDWSDSPGFGASAPAWAPDETAEGVVRLYGPRGRSPRPPGPTPICSAPSSPQPGPRVTSTPSRTR